MFKKIPLSDLTIKITDGSHFSPTPVEQGRLIANVKDMQGGHVNLDSCTRISDKDYSKLDASGCVAKKNDVLLSKDGTVGKVAIVDDDNQLATLSSIAIIRTLEQANHRYVGQFLKSEDAKRQYDNAMSGSALRRLVLRDINSLKIPTPPKVEQELIAHLLDTLDTQIQKTEALIAKLEKVKEGLLHDLLTRGIDESGQLRPSPEKAPELYKESPLGLIPREWSCQELAAAADVQRGRFTHRPRNDPAFYGGDYPFIQTGDVAAAKGGIVIDFSQTLSRLGTTASSLFPARTIAITIAANIADTAILGRPMYFPDSVVGAVVNDGANARFVELCIRRAKRSLDARAPQSAQKNINLQDLRPLLIPFPCLCEQNRIAESYEVFMGRVLAERQKLTKLKSEKIALMDDLLTGRVRVTPLLEKAQATTPA
ncbi:restriction endonuclease subunit S [Halomonas tibetensis]|uniref:Restriction endonuclease subunit S n=1 Tax=Halomonas tibetensis TaxID=2259590 RepID=A0ABV7B3I5_9GAMM